MADKNTVRRYGERYARLLRLYPAPYRQRFGEAMRQTFEDALNERNEERRTLFTRALWMYADTSVGIIKAHNVSLFMQNNTSKRLGMWAGIVAILMLIPLVAMQFTSEMRWTLSDFVFMAVILFGAAAVYELVAKRLSNGWYRAAVGVAVVTSVALVWINGAVGIIGDGPINLLYAGVLAVGLVGALIARFRPDGMAHTLYAMAVAQMLVPTVAFVVRRPEFSPGVIQVFALNGVFALLFVGSALLFRKSATMLTTKPALHV